jgi:hypothetical protein
MLQRKTARVTMEGGKFKKTAAPDDHTRLRASACAVHAVSQARQSEASFCGSKQRRASIDRMIIDVIVIRALSGAEVIASVSMRRPRPSGSTPFKCKLR